MTNNTLTPGQVFFAANTLALCNDGNADDTKELSIRILYTLHMFQNSNQYYNPFRLCACSLFFSDFFVIFFFP